MLRKFEMTIKPIKTEADYNDAINRLEQLMTAQVNTPEGDELDILAELVNLYEERHFPIDLPNPIDAILFRIEQMGLGRVAFGELIGSRSHASEVLNFKRRLSMPMAQKLHNEWHIPANVLLQPYELVER